MRPRIGITCWHRKDADGLERWEAIRESYARAVAAVGGLPLILPIGAGDPEEVDAYLAALDGLLFTGGEDIAPAYYGASRDERCGEPDAERDLFEIHLARAALARQVPAFGICRGLQLLNVAAGGTLHQDLACRPDTAMYHSAALPERRNLIHPVRILPGTRLHALMRVAESRVTSTHHQFVRDLAPGFQASAVSAEDGIIEAIEAPDHPFLLAVQWHPERMCPAHAEQVAVFREFVRQAGAGG